MARPKKYTDDEIVRQFHEYRYQYPDRSVTLPDLGSFMRKYGMEIQDHTLRRCKPLRELLDELKCDDTDRKEKLVAVYHTLDADEFLEKYHNKTELKKALIKRDRYYADIADTAVSAMRKAKIASKKLEDLQKEHEALKKAHLVSASEIASLKRKVLELEAAVKRAKEIIRDYLYPEAANMILRKTGLIKDDGPVTLQETLEFKDDDTVKKILEHLDSLEKKDETEKPEEEKPTDTDDSNPKEEVSAFDAINKLRRRFGE